MSNRELAKSLIDQIPESKLLYIIAYLQGAAVPDDEAEDDAFCERLYQEYLDDPEKDESYTLEECKKEWGLA